jgi:cell division septal protein FtsQ
MEEIEGVNCSSESRPPHPNPSIASAFRQCQRNDPVVLPCRKSLVRHASLVRIFCFIVIIIIIMLLIVFVWFLLLLYWNSYLLQHLLLFLK